jgi:hypothetical protein
VAERFDCPVCGNFVEGEKDTYEICENCRWEDNAFQEDHPEDAGGPNKMSLNEAREAYKKGIPLR